MSDRSIWDKQLSLGALDAVVLGRPDGIDPKIAWTPNWQITARIPHQRLQGLRRRGFLDYSGGHWKLTEQGEEYRLELANELLDQPLEMAA